MTVKFYLAPGVINRKFYLAPGMRNGQIYLAANDSFEKFYLAVKELKNRFVSSANMMNLAILYALTISFIKRMNKRGPKMEPSGTPHVTGKVSELV